MIKTYNRKIELKIQFLFNAINKTVATQLIKDLIFYITLILYILI